MADKLYEVGKILGQAKKDAETAIRRYQATHPKIERVRDIFDVTTPFEMEFETESYDSLYTLDLFFNKAPPLKVCGSIPCKEFITGSGPQLLDVGEPYVSGTVVVFRNGVLTTDFSEYSYLEGKVWVGGTSDPVQVFNVCYNTDTRALFCNSLEDDLILHHDMINSHLSVDFQAVNSTQQYIYYNPDDVPLNATGTVFPIPKAFLPTTKSHTLSFKLQSTTFPPDPGPPPSGSPTFHAGHRVIVQLFYNGGSNVAWELDIRQEISRKEDGGSLFDVSGGFDWLNPNNYYQGYGLSRFHFDRGRMVDDAAGCVAVHGDVCYANPGAVGDIWVQIDYDLDRGDAYIHTNLGMNYVKLLSSVVAEGELSNWYISVQSQAWNHDSSGGTAYPGDRTFEWVMKDLFFCEREITYT